MEDDLYHGLGLGDNDIRLVAIHPDPNRTGKVVCRLTRHSLADTTAAYQGFLSKIAVTTTTTSDTDTAPALSKRQLTTLWKNQTSGFLPSGLIHRWTWGDYAALSYVWGDERQRDEITVNGRPVSVTANLAVALRRFAWGGDGKWGGARGFRLWVDALCINQKDLSERERQIGRMRGIYGESWAVVAWLGEESFQSDMAIGLVKDLAEMSRAGASGKMVAETIAREPDCLGSGCWSALNSLMERAYWFRLWILQEIIMGASATRVRCGAAEIDWASFYTGVEFLEDHLWLAKDIAMGREQGVDWAAWTVGGLHLVHQDLMALSEREEKGGEFPSFGRLLDLANSSACKDPTDKVYALVGLMEPRIASRLKTDYTLSAAHVYASTARTFIEVCDNLEPIREGNPWGPSKTPSWAADWQWRGRLRWSRVESRLWCEAVLTWSDSDSSSRNTTRDNHIPYQASGNTQHDSLFSVEDSLLSCSGFIVDSISGLGARGVAYFEIDPLSVVQPCPPWKSAYGDLTGTIEALGSTLIMDRVSSGRRAERRHVSAMLHMPATFVAAEAEFLRRGWTWLAGQAGYFFRWENFRRANSKFMLGSDRLDDFFTDEIPADTSERDMTEVYSSFDRTTHKRRFITTGTGYMGWGPDNVYGSSDEQLKQGDLIAILFGCSTPIVVRPCGQHFQVLGEAYVQGLMDGEAMTLLRKGTCQVQKFIFC
ncbi:hypothetical protein BR93DRAFT_882710 [Coniochaeta sp. PMI_546]|nr:hypothetical protein BR93DRAFT_882710 [Coniochaeta sp. PMI_546]